MKTQNNLKQRENKKKVGKERGKNRKARKKKKEEKEEKEKKIKKNTIHERKKN